MFNPTGTVNSFTLATVVFLATATVPPDGQLASIAITVTTAGNELGGSVLASLTAVGLQLCIAVPEAFGDVSGDNVVNIIDAQQIARFAIGLPPPPHPVRVARLGDVNRGRGGEHHRCATDRAVFGGAPHTWRSPYWANTFHMS